MKKKNYLCKCYSTSGVCYKLSRGEKLECEIVGLALVRLDIDNELTFKGNWSIIDIASGLFIITGNSKKRVLQDFNDSLITSDLKNRIMKARNCSRYIIDSLNTENEREIWRKSGYAL